MWIRWNELLSPTLSSLPDIKNQLKAGRRSPAPPEAEQSMRRELWGPGVALRPPGESGKAGRVWLTLLEQESSPAPAPWESLIPQWHRGCRRAFAQEETHGKAGLHPTAAHTPSSALWPLLAPRLRAVPYQLVWYGNKYGWSLKVGNIKEPDIFLQNAGTWPKVGI